MNKGEAVKLAGVLAKVARHPKAKEVVGVLLMTFSLLFLVSLLSFDPQDPSFFHYLSREKRISNFGGKVGAHLSGDLLGVLGVAAFLLPPYLFLIGFSMVAERCVRPLSFRLITLAPLLFSTCLFMSLLEGDGLFPPFRGERLGGFLGEELALRLRPALGTFGLYLTPLTGFLIFFILISQDSLRGLTRSLQEILKWLGRRLPGLLPSRRPEGSKRQSLTPVVAPAKPPAPAEAPPTVSVAPPELSLVQTEGEGPPRSSRRPSGRYQPPPLTLLDPPPPGEVTVPPEELKEKAEILERTLRDFGVEGRVAEIHPGPVITRYEIEPAPGIKINRIVHLADDLALALKAMSVRVVAPIPGKAVVGVEIPNQQRVTVHLREILTSREFKASPSGLTVALGKDIAGRPIVADLIQMPHLLIAGATGSGKSVGINAIILSLLFSTSPEDLRLLLIDPKRVELSLYNGTPHLIDRVVVEPREAAKRLGQVVGHMEERYRLFAEVGARKLSAYNDMARKSQHLTPLPFLVVIIDELADLMLIAQSDVENVVARLTQMARAVGIHLVVATQRPSVDVITGVIKANFPARIAFHVSSKVDSRTILDVNGAETLLGNGDMLFLPPGSSKPARIHGCYVSEAEIRRVVAALSSLGPPEAFPLAAAPEEDRGGAQGYEDELYDQAIHLVMQTRQASISMLQRRLRVGFNRAARMIERMEQEGIVSPMDGTRPREVLVDPEAQERWRKL